MALLPFFRCPACDRTPDTASFPLCGICAQSLIDCPPLCPNCLNPGACGSTPESCLKPWRTPPTWQRLQSVSARYLLVGPGYSVLKRWKTGSGSALDHLVLRSNPMQDSAWKKHEVTVLVPMPQSWTRSWMLGNRPSLKISRWLERESRIPVLDALAPSEQPIRQAELSLQERLGNRIFFPPGPESSRIAGNRALLVDDFITSGRSIRAAAEALHRLGATEVHAFALGFRPPRQAARELDLETLPEPSAGSRSPGPFEA